MDEDWRPRLSREGYVFYVVVKKRCSFWSNGQNIYPEEIEAKIAMLPFMNEAIVVQREGKKNIAIVTIDRPALQKAGYKIEKDIEKLLEDNRKALNTSIASFLHRLKRFEVLEGDFEKTPKQSIKRYLYRARRVCQKAVGVFTQNHITEQPVEPPRLGLQNCDSPSRFPTFDTPRSI